MTRAWRWLRSGFRFPVACLAASKGLPPLATVDAPRHATTSTVLHAHADTTLSKWLALLFLCVAASGAPIAIAQAPNYQGLWWKSPAGSESGWGINFAHQGDIIFATWFTYDTTGKAWWLTMTANKTADNTYAGTIYQTRGPAFNAVPFSPGQVTVTPVGSGTLSFTDTSTGTFAYTVNGVSQTKAIAREVFGTPPTCTFGTQPNFALATNYQDLWWAAPPGSESGWGINLTHQGDTIFATWFTYDVDGTPLWLAVTAIKTAPGTYSGTQLFRLTGPPFNSIPFPPLGAPGGAVASNVGTAKFTFTDGNTGSFTYTVNGVTQSKNITRELFQPPAGTICQVGNVPLLGRYRIATRGLWVGIERRGSAFGYPIAQLMQQLDTFDGAVGSTIATETSLQLQVMKSMGINTISLADISSDLGDGMYSLPACSLGPLGLQWPQPTAAELSGLRKFFDLAESNGIKVQFMLNNTHMDDLPKSQIWLSAILGVIGNHPALDFVAFGGDLHVLTLGSGVPASCGGLSEAPLWLGPSAQQGAYVQWAIGYGLSLGIASRKLTAEAIVGDYYTESQPARFWTPIATLKSIFDNLGIPNDQRTYAISFYEHTKCSTARGLPCVDADPHAWAEETLRNLFNIVGTSNGARVVAPEMGDLPPIRSAWPPQSSLESLISLMEKYGVDGGSYWIWTETDNAREADPAFFGEPVKLRGTAFRYNPVQKEVLDMGGFHLIAIANSSFESGDAAPSNWTIGASGVGTASRYFLAGESGQPTVPTRGSYSLRLMSGSAGNR